jgi:hypothetical protein
MTVTEGTIRQYCLIPALPIGEFGIKDVTLRRCFKCLQIIISNSLTIIDFDLLQSS